MPLANDVLRDEYGAKLGHPAQIRYCSSDPEDITGKALERTAHVFGCLTCTEDDIFLDMENDLKPMSLLAVANNLFLKKYQDNNSLMSLFTKGDKE